MSLSFVASAVQTGTSDGRYEETPIDSKEVAAVNRRNAHKPLFEQLRENQEEEQSKMDEMQREMMRGTRALNEEDVAHLDALERQRREREQAINERTQEELSAFRAARAENQQYLLEENEANNDDNEDDNEEDKNEDEIPVTPTASFAPSVPSKHLVPIIKVKRKRLVKAECSKKPKTEATSAPPPENDLSGGLAGLLGAYGSDSDSG
jgi:hypothetical protein